MTNFKYPTFIDLRYDFAFKSIFGTQGNEDLLLKLINAILPEKHFTSVSLMNNEQMGLRKESRRAVFDVFATTSDGSDFTIEMQLNDQADFNQRMVFYSSFPVQNLVKKGKGKDGEPELYYTFPHVYVIGITNFILSQVPYNNEIINSYSIRNERDPSSALTDKVTYVTVELPKLTKTLSELSSPEDFLFYAIKNIGTMKAMPKEFKGKGLEGVENQGDVDVLCVKMRIGDTDVGEIQKVTENGMRRFILRPLPGAHQERLKSRQWISA